jgi:hypothetical protein
MAASAEGQYAQVPVRTFILSGAQYLAHERRLAANLNCGLHVAVALVAIREKELGPRLD